MKIVLFELAGEMAMWRNVYESMGAFSCLGPAPSNLAGLLGAALGFASPRSQAADCADQKRLSRQSKKGLPWPLSPELLEWEERNDLHVACRWIGAFPCRVPWNVNGCKEIGKGENLRMQQQVILNPRYEVAARVGDDEAERLATALACPAFPLCLGASFCRAIVRDIRVEGNLPEVAGWAFVSQLSALGEVVPLSRHVVDPESQFERILSDGYWVYPTPEVPGIVQPDPMVRTWVRQDVKNE